MPKRHWSEAATEESILASKAKEFTAADLLSAIKKVRHEFAEKVMCSPEEKRQKDREFIDEFMPRPAIHPTLCVLTIHAKLKKIEGDKDHMWELSRDKDYKGTVWTTEYIVSNDIPETLEIANPAFDIYDFRTRDKPVWGDLTTSVSWLKDDVEAAIARGMSDEDYLRQFHLGWGPRIVEEKECIS
jgi:hypothetical protein